MSNPDKIRDLITQIGRAHLRERLSVENNTISMAIGRGRLPATWFAVITEECADRGISCPPELFGMRGATQ